MSLIYDLPTWLLCALVVGAYSAVSLAGLEILRP